VRGALSATVPAYRPGSAIVLQRMTFRPGSLMKPGA
jgi:hypothetical protein